MKNKAMTNEEKILDCRKRKKVFGIATIVAAVATVVLVFISVYPMTMYINNKSDYIKTEGTIDCIYTVKSQGKVVLSSEIAYTYEGNNYFEKIRADIFDNVDKNVSFYVNKEYPEEIVRLSFVGKVPDTRAMYAVGVFLIAVICGIQWIFINKELKFAELSLKAYNNIKKQDEEEK